MKDTIWFDRYRVIRLLGEGATSRVYLCNYEVLNQYRAIKCISKRKADYEQAKEEAQLLLQLKSPAIPMIYDIMENDENLYIIEEYIEGESLLSYRNRSQRLSESIILELSLQICDLFLYLHSMKVPILYLDCKPSNFLIHNQVIRLVDFGSAQRKQEGVFRRSYGTKGFAAPEQYKESILNEVTDIYGIGMLIYFLMTGEHKFDQSRDCYAGEFYSYSRKLQSVVKRAIRHNSCERYESVRAIKEQLIRIKKKETMASTSKSIALIGANQGVGVTHLAFYLLSQLHQAGNKVIYVECGISNVVELLLLEAKEVAADKICYQGCFLTRAQWFDESQKDQYDYIIYDYGMITKTILQSFYKADIPIAVIGGHTWEIPRTKHMLNMLEKDEKVRYVVNHLSVAMYHKQIRNFQGIRLYRMPLEADAFAKHQSLVKEFVTTLLE